ncbi:MAG: class I SAM-dependent methyltransferase [Prolixibacteraceae bacterium]|nr:class I SAM-dependent methyltransferase [Prolixibacteraceae bacterium]
MRQAIDSNRETLFFHLEDSLMIGELIPKTEKSILVSNKVYFCYLDGIVLNNLKDIFLINNLILTRYLDRFYFLFSTERLEIKQEIIDVFFEIIALDYDELIDVERNISNINFLLNIIIKDQNSFGSLRILDYGCGTGLSQQFVRNGLEIIGYDRCPIMRNLSERRGLQVIDDEILMQIKDGSFDAVFASYVFHLFSNTNNLCTVWNKLKPKGIFIGNFHKGKGINVVDFFRNELKGEVIIYKSVDYSKIHGEYFGFRKK